MAVEFRSINLTWGNKMKKPVLTSLAVAVLAMSALSANAADLSVTSNAIYGGGNSNGGFTVNTTNGVEVGLRVHKRYPSPSDSAADIGSNNNGTYNQAAGGFGPSSARAGWNFDWSINTDPTSTGTGKVSDYTYLIGMDFDPSFGDNFQTFDLINGVNPNPAAGGLALWDHSFGNNTTAMSAGVEAAGATLALALTDYNSLKGANNLVQNSWNFEFFDDGGLFSFDPTVNGNYKIFLQVLDSGGEVARSDIEVIVGTGFVPEPGSLALVGLALTGLAVSRRRKLTK